MEPAEETTAAKGVPAALVVLLFLLAFGLLILLLFVPAGRLDWWQGWLYLGLLAASSVTLSVRLWRTDPELCRRRLSAGKGTKGWDLALLQVIKFTFFGAIVLAALDGGRFGWSAVPVWATAVAAIVHTVGFAIMARAMLANTHFESTVRIQEDRDHAVVDTGPYAIVRHPGYSGFLFIIAATPPLLGSLFAFLPLAVVTAVIVLRTALEDRMLSRELPGYAEYRERVRWRLVPRIW